MAASYMTYNNLVRMVKSYLNRGYSTDLGYTDQDIKDQIMLAEARLSMESKILGNMLAVTGYLTAGNPTLAKPSRWRETVDLAIDANNEYTKIERRTYEYMSSYWGNRNVRSTPKYYCDYSDEFFLILPTPDFAYAYEMICYITPGPLSEATQTNYWTNNAPNCLLYATLLESAPFLKDDERIPVWEKMYDRALAALNGEDQRHPVDRGTMEGA